MAVADTEVTIKNQTHAALHPAAVLERTPARHCKISVVVPLLNEEANVLQLVEKLSTELNKLKQPYEIILVNDGSTDRTAQLLNELSAKDPAIVAVHFARRYGQTAAMTGGIDQATGGIIVCMDGDMQNDPADIERMLHALDEGFDVVCGWRKNRKDAFIRVLPSKIANEVISYVSGVKLHDYGCTLKAFRREFAKDMRLYGEMHRFIPIYASWQGARIHEIVVNHHPRTRGKSNYGFERTFKVLLDLMVVQFLARYSTKPIYLFGGFGFLSLLGSLLSAVGALAFKLIPVSTGWHKDFVMTPLPVLSIGLFAVAVQLILIGLLAEVQIRTYYESQDKRTYIIRSIAGRRRSPDETERPQSS